MTQGYTDPRGLRRNDEAQKILDEAKNTMVGDSWGLTERAQWAQISIAHSLIAIAEMMVATKEEERDPEGMGGWHDHAGGGPEAQEAQEVSTPSIAEISGPKPLRSMPYAEAQHAAIRAAVIALLAHRETPRFSPEAHTLKRLLGIRSHEILLLRDALRKVDGEPT